MVNIIKVDFETDEEEAELVAASLTSLLSAFIDKVGHSFNLRMRRETWEKVIPIWVCHYPPKHVFASTSHGEITLSVSNETVDSLAKAMRTYQSLPFNGAWYSVEIEE